MQLHDYAAALLVVFTNLIVAAQDDNRLQTGNSESSSSDSELEHRLPTAIVIGVKKAGTRALLEFLRLNPMVRAPGPEVHFFDRHYDRGLDWYRRQMPLTTSQQMTVEKTPRYFITKMAPERVYKMNPNVKLLVVVRDPVTRAISDYTQTASKRADMPSFTSMALTNTSDINTSWGAIKIGIYYRHTKRWLNYFPLSQIHFVSGEALIRNPAAVMYDVETFLGLPHLIKRRQFHLYGAKGFPCIVKSETSHFANPDEHQAHHSGLQDIASDEQQSNIHCLGKTKGRNHPMVSDQLMAQLRTFYRPWNEKFYALVGRKFYW